MPSTAAAVAQLQQVAEDTAVGQRVVGMSTDARFAWKASSIMRDIPPEMRRAVGFLMDCARDTQKPLGEDDLHELHALLPPRASTAAAAVPGMTATIHSDVADVAAAPSTHDRLEYGANAPDIAADNVASHVAALDAPPTSLAVADRAMVTAGCGAGAMVAAAGCGTMVAAGRGTIVRWREDALAMMTATVPPPLLTHADVIATFPLVCFFLVCLRLGIAGANAAKPNNARTMASDAVLEIMGVPNWKLKESKSDHRVEKYHGYNLPMRQLINQRKNIVKEAHETVEDSIERIVNDERFVHASLKRDFMALGMVDAAGRPSPASMDAVRVATVPELQRAAIFAAANETAAKAAAAMYAVR